jgi:hypothetical protein
VFVEQIATFQIVYRIDNLTHPHSNAEEYYDWARFSKRSCLGLYLLQKLVLKGLC